MKRILVDLPDGNSRRNPRPPRPDVRSPMDLVPQGPPSRRWRARRLFSEALYIREAIEIVSRCSTAAVETPVDWDVQSEFVAIEDSGAATGADLFNPLMEMPEVPLLWVHRTEQQFVEFALCL